MTDLSTHCKIAYASLTEKAKIIEKNIKLFHSKVHSYCPEEKKPNNPVHQEKLLKKWLKKLKAAHC